VNSVNLGSAYYTPSSVGPYEFTVQENMVMSWPPAPLPTDYWTRPVSPMNREWAPILGSFPATGRVGGGADWPANTNRYMSNYNFVPYVQGPSSAHILWKEQKDIGGLIGGPAGTISDVTPGGGMSGSGYPTIVYAGRAYERYTKPGMGLTAPTYWKCYDLRTGQVYWDRPVESGEPAPTFVEYHNQGAEVPGAYARAGITVYLTAIVNPSGSTDGRIIKYNPWTGAVAVNITGPPPGVSSNALYGYPFVLGIQDLGSAAGANRYRLINWTIENNAGEWRFAGGGSQLTVQNFTERIISNITWPMSSLGTRQDFEASVAVFVSAVNAEGNPPPTGVSIGQRLVGVNLLTGTVMWNVTTDLTKEYETFFSTSTAVADHGKFAVLLNSGDVYCWSLQTGAIVWKCTAPTQPWSSFGAYSVTSAYGLIFSGRYDGIHAINWTNGNIEWSFKGETPYAFETPYHSNGTGVYAFHGAGMVADGKLYMYSVEHTPSQPITRGDKLYCLDALTGRNIWNISLSQNIGGSRAFQGAIADGYLTHTSTYDAMLYTFGKGRSTTTITAPKTAITLGQQLVIDGTVLDLSPAQPGTPCVSQDSMGKWMEYLHMQQQIPSDVTGVKVSIDAMDPNGNSMHIATITTDGYSGTFGYAWQPEIAGFYVITATFMGDESYGSSFATTYVTVTEAQETPTPTQTTITMPPFELYTIGAAIAIIFAIAIAVLLLRKRP
jgi:outer membrane protein assembly factor BamB